MTEGEKSPKFPGFSGDFENFTRILREKNKDLECKPGVSGGENPRILRKFPRKLWTNTRCVNANLKFRISIMYYKE